MPNIGPTELVIVLAVALLILGPKRLPAAGRSLGHGMREFKDSITDSTRSAANDDAPAIPATPITNDLEPAHQVSSDRSM